MRDPRDLRGEANVPRPTFDVSGRDMLLVGAVAMGAVAVFGAALFALGGVAGFGGLPIRVVTSLEPSDRTILASLVKDVRVASSKLSASIDQAVDHGVNV